jgi:hypothetical protein
MPFLSDIAEKVKNRAAGLFSGPGAGSFLRAAAERIVNLVHRAAGLVKGRGEKLWVLFPASIREKLPWLEGKIGFVLTGTALALIILLVAVLAIGKPAPEEPEAALFRPAPIPPEDLFLPEEPDFLPPVILDRGRRETWTAEDAEPFWYNPLEEDEERWRELVEKAVDDLLERVP